MEFFAVLGAGGLYKGLIDLISPGPYGPKWQDELTCILITIIAMVVIYTLAV